MKRIWFDTLGCDKNLVDSEAVAGLILKGGSFSLAENVYQADYVFINSCGFIDTAKEESIETILEYVKLREDEKLSFKIIAMGCLVELYKDELQKELPEVDFWVKPNQYGDIKEIINGMNIIDTGEKGYIKDFSQRVALNNSYTRFLKISDGCNLNCSYCIIPKIRGNLKSRTLEDIKNELDLLYEDKKLKELIVVSQNNMFYGIDNGENIVKLLDLLGKYDFFWKRLLYLDIRKIDETFLEAMKRNNILPYFDIPLQHIDNTVLKDMNRNYTEKEVMEKIELIYKHFDNPILRTTFIVGFPTETETAFDKLKKFIKKGIFHKVGIFEYSPQSESESFKLGDPVSQKIKSKRREELMEIQQEISSEKLKNFIGKTFDLLVEYEGEEGRIWCDAPDVDGVVFINDKNARKGHMYKVKIIDSYEYDLEGEILNEIHS